MASKSLGHQQVQQAYDSYEALKDKPAASGVILHRKDELVADLKFKWIPCIWKITAVAEDGNDSAVLTLQPASGIAQEENAYPIRNDTQYKAPKSKHYPLQFGTSALYTTAILQTVVYLNSSGFAPSPMDIVNPNVAAGAQSAVESMGKVASLEMKDLEKLLACIQAVKEGKSPDAYLSKV